LKNTADLVKSVSIGRQLDSGIFQKEELLKYLNSIPGILAVLELLGSWDLDIDIHAENARYCRNS